MKFKLLFALLLITVGSKAQENNKNFALGFTLFPNVSWSSNDGEELISKDPGIGFSYGVIADLGFAENYFFSTGFTLTSLSHKIQRPGISTDKHRIQYIEIPLTLKLKTNPVSSERFYAQFGLTTGINTSAKIKPANGASPLSGENNSVQPDVNIFRLGLVAGAGAEWNIARNLRVVNGVSFNNGFTKTFKDYNSKSSYISLHLGVFF